MRNCGGEGSGRVHEGAVAADFLWLLHAHGGKRHQGQRQVVDGVGIANGGQRVMARLFDLQFLHTAEGLLDGLALAVEFFEARRVALDARAGVVGEVLVGGAPVVGELGMAARAAAGMFGRDCFVGFERATFFEPCAIAFTPDAGGGHFQAGLAKPVSALGKLFVGLGATRIEGNDRLGLDLLDEKGVEVALVIGLVGDDDHAFLGLVEALEFLEQFARDLGVGHVVGPGAFEEGQARVGVDDGVGAVTPEKDELFFFGLGIGQRHVGIIAEGGRWISFWLPGLVSLIAANVFGVVVFGQRPDRLGVDGDHLEGENLLLDEDFVGSHK